jgi:hypothetical protein
MLPVMFIYYEDCPSHDLALERLRQIIAEEGIEAAIEIVKVETDEQAAELHFIGSPTIRIAGQDIDPPPAIAQFALTCRAYRRPDGRISPLPPPELIRRGLRAAVGR